MPTQLMIPGFDHKAENEATSQRVADGYINATAMCKAAGKQMSDYNRFSTTKLFLNKLSSVAGVSPKRLIIAITGGENETNRV